MVQGLEYISLPISVPLHPLPFCSVLCKVERAACVHCDSERRGYHTSCTGGSHHGPVVPHSAESSVFSTVVW